MRVEHRHGRSSSLVKAQTDILQLNFESKVRGFLVRAVSLKNAKLEPGVHLLLFRNSRAFLRANNLLLRLSIAKEDACAFAIASAVTHLFIMHTAGVLWRST